MKKKAKKQLRKLKEISDEAVSYLNSSPKMNSDIPRSLLLQKNTPGFSSEEAGNPPSVFMWEKSRRVMVTSSLSAEAAAESRAVLRCLPCTPGVVRCA